MYHKLVIGVLIWIELLSCGAEPTHGLIDKGDTLTTKNAEKQPEYSVDTAFKVIHIYVALCDNKYQGIVPVPDKIGNGQVPSTNLYWGAGYGIKTYFSKSNEWLLIKTVYPDSVILERLLFKHRTKNYYLVADAYNGKFTQQCTIDFLKASCGQKKDTLQFKTKTIGTAGFANLVCYIGHDGLMEFDLDNTFINTDHKKRDVIILACSSKTFFSPYLQKASVNPLVWTSNLMAPEAYTIHDAISGYINNETNESIRTRAASAYAKYQKCGIPFAKNLLVTGW